MKTDNELDRLIADVREMARLYKAASPWKRFQFRMLLKWLKIPARLRTIALWAVAALAGVLLGLAIDTELVNAFFKPWAALAPAYGAMLGIGAAMAGGRQL